MRPAMFVAVVLRSSAVRCATGVGSAAVEKRAVARDPCVTGRTARAVPRSSRRIRPGLAVEQKNRTSSTNMAGDRSPSGARESASMTANRSA